MTTGKAAGLVVSPTAISRYGVTIGDQQGQLERINAALAGVHVPADAFGKLPEAGDLYRAYSQHASEVLDVTGKLPGQIDNVAQGLLATAKSYSDLESGMAEGIASAFASVGSGGGSGYGYSAPSTAEGELTSGFANILDDSNQAYGWISSPEESLPPLAVKNLFPPSGLITGGIEAAVGWILDHAPVLCKLLDDVTGDIEALKAAAEVWHDAGNRVNLVVREMRSSARELPEAWGGAASAEFGGFMGDVTEGLGMLTTTMGQTQQVLEDAVAEANFAHETISMIISQVIEWVAGNILVDAITLGLATAADAAATAAFLAEKVKEAEQAASRLATFYRALQRVLGSLKDMKDAEDGFKAVKAFKEAKGLQRLTRFFSVSGDLDHALEAGKLTNLRYFGDGKLAKLGRTVLESGKHGPDAKAVREIADLGKDGVVNRIALKVGVSGAEALTGLPVDKGAVGLAKDLADGSLRDLQQNGQGAADTVGLAPSAQGPPVNRIDALINYRGLPKEK